MRATRGLKTRQRARSSDSHQERAAQGRSRHQCPVKELRLTVLKVRTVEGPRHVLAVVALGVVASPFSFGWGGASY